MGNIITGLFAIALIIAGALALTGRALSSASDLSLSWERMAGRDRDQSATQLTLITADIQGAGTDIDISFRNTGQTRLSDIADWDALIQYYAQSGNTGLSGLWATYTTSTPSHGQWTTTGIYLDAAASVAEVYEPGILNPGEEIVVRLTISPAIPIDTDNLATIGVANGVTLAAPFSR